MLAVQPFESHYRRVRTLVGGTGHRKVDAETYSQVRDLVVGEEQYPTPRPTLQSTSRTSAEDLQVWRFCDKARNMEASLAEDMVRLGRLDVANMSPKARTIADLVARGRRQTSSEAVREIVLESLCGVRVVEGRGGSQGAGEAVGRRQ